MMTRVSIQFLCAFLAAVLPATPLLAGAEAAPANAIVAIRMSRTLHSPVQPWVQKQGSGAMWGVAIGQRTILTLASGLENLTLLRIQKSGRGRWWTGQIIATDVVAGLGLVTVDEDAFWDDIRPLPLATNVPTEGTAQLMCWQDGRMKEWKASITGVKGMPVAGSTVQHMKLMIMTDAPLKRSGEALVKEGSLLGIRDIQIGRHASIIPAPYIRHVIDAVLTSPRGRLGFFDMKLQYAVSPTMTGYLGLEGEPRGVVVTQPPESHTGAGTLQKKDLILSIDGLDIDSRGEYRDPAYGYLSMACLSTRKHLAGDELIMDVLRDGKRLSVKYRLPPGRMRIGADPEEQEEGKPEYLLAGGALFLNLTPDYVSALGRAAPIHLRTAVARENDHDDRVIILSQFFQDEHCLGYVQYRNLVVERVNGKPIASMSALEDALETPVDGTYHVIEFAPNLQRQQIVLDAKSMPAATTRVMTRYSIPSDRCIKDRQGQRSIPPRLTQ